MSIVKSVLIYGYGEGTIGASLAMALAGKPVHVFACWPTLSEMSQFEDIPNITPLKLNPESPLGIQQAKEQLMTRLSTGGLNILINAGYIGHESIRGCTVERRAALWRSHISSLDQISLAFRPLLIASRGTIVNLVNHEIAIYDLMIRKSHCGYCISFNPLTNWQESLPNAPIGIKSDTARLCDELAPVGVKVMIIGPEGENAGVNLISDGPGAWSDIPALAEDIIRDIFRLPGEGRVL